jgi:hypothetical protein
MLLPSWLREIGAAAHPAVQASKAGRTISARWCPVNRKMGKLTQVQAVARAWAALTGCPNGGLIAVVGFALSVAVTAQTLPPAPIVLPPTP